MSDTDLLSTSRLARHWLALLGCVIALIAIGAVCADYMHFQASKRQALTVVAELGGRAGGIGGWPLGEENIITFDRDLSDKEIDRLAILNTMSARHSVSVYFKNCNWSTSRAAGVRDVLHRCHIYVDAPVPGNEKEHVR